MTPARRGNLIIGLLLLLAVTLPALFAYRAGVEYGRDQRDDELEQRIDHLEQEIANLKE